MKISLSNSDLPHFVILLLFSIDLSTYFAEHISVSLMKGLVCLCAVLCMVKYKSRIKQSGFHTLSVWPFLILYMGMLSLRLIIDFIIPWKGFFLYTSPLTIVFFFILTMLAPMLFWGNKKVQLDSEKVCLLLSTVLTICLVMSFRANLSSLAIATINGQHSGEGTVDVISYGHYGCTLLLIGVFILMNGSIKYKILLSILFVLVGLSAIILSGSRSPILAMMICLIILFLSRVKKLSTLMFIFVSFSFIIGIGDSILGSFNDFLESKDVYSFKRVIDTLLSEETISTSGRDDIYQQGVNLFCENIFLGSSYLLPDESYVHNIFIEQFMALGILGGGLFLVINAISLFYSWKVIKWDPHNSIFPILFIQYLVFGLFSRTIIALIPYWLFMFVSLNIYSNNKKNGYGISYHSNV